MMFVTQRPYVPIGTLRAAASYPASEAPFDDVQIQEAFHLLGLDGLQGLASTSRLLGISSSPPRAAAPRARPRAAPRPDWILLDKSTSALDEESERQVYALLAERLPAGDAAVHRAPGRRRAAITRGAGASAPRNGRVVLEAA
jgi:putative ATP-binding cassette transporter